MIRSILFDLDNTLLNFTWAERIALSKTLKQLGVEPTEKILNRYHELNNAQWKALERGEITRDQVKVRRYQLLFEELGVTASPQEATSIYETFLAVGHCYIDGAQELLEHLYKKYDLYLVTNGTAKVQRGRLDSADMWKYFKNVFISEEIGYDKPSKEYFDCCFDRMPEFHIEEALLVGDSLTADILGGRNTGIKTVWFNPRGEENHTDIHPDQEIRRLEELYAIVS